MCALTAVRTPRQRDKYLQKYAEPEAYVEPPTGKRYQAAIVVPACGESHEFLTQWDQTLNEVDDHLLVVLVLNADSQTSPEHQHANAQLAAQLSSRSAQRLSSSPPMHLVAYERFDVLFVDRTRPEHLLPNKCGVGLARKIGGDVACAWHTRGAVTNAWWISTDADVVLPADIVRQLGNLGDPACVVCLPFEHVRGEDARVTDATWAVEVELRYHALGLAYAGSNYAWPALGSCLAIHTDAYTSVRGFPKRQAGEDHYLLQKASKLSPVRFVGGEPVRILPRRSSRTPFGTGRSVEELLRNGMQLTLRNPACYAYLREVITHLDALATHAEWSTFAAWARNELPPDIPVAQVLTNIGAEAAWARTCELNLNPETRARRLHEWFDGLRQIQFLRGLEASLPTLSCEVALGNAPFTRGALDESCDPTQPDYWYRSVCGLRKLSQARLGAAASRSGLTRASV